ncbi:MAG TPA: RsiV family protein [Acidimicrobiales bacterium]|nr:RsiV family protein [Acidimicrobiales bacterium]
MPSRSARSILTAAVALLCWSASGCATDAGRGLSDPQSQTVVAPATASPQVGAATATLAPPAVSPAGSWIFLPATPLLSVERLTGTIEPDGTFDMAFPSVDGDGVAHGVDARLRQPVEHARALFAADLFEDESADVEPSHLFGGGIVSLLDTRVVSVEYDLTVEWGGAASGDQWVDAVVVDLADGSLVGPLDVFYDDSPWLETLARVATADLAARFGENVLWPDGLSVEESNFEHLALSAEGVILLFDRYQIGPGVLGAPRVSVPWSDIGEFVDPNGPVGHLVAG